MIRRSRVALAVAVSISLATLPRMSAADSDAEGGRSGGPQVRPRASSRPAPTDACGDAPVIGDGTYTGEMTQADNDATASCGFSETPPDVWWRYVAPADATVVARIVGADTSTALSVHTSCPGTTSSEIVCTDLEPATGFPSVKFSAEAGEEVLIRVGGFVGEASSFTLLVGRTGTVSGTVVRAATGEPLAEATVQIWNELGNSFIPGTTDVEGEYAVEVGPGTYFAAAAAGGGLLGEVYEDSACYNLFFNDCDPTSGTPIEVSSATTVVGIDFSLDMGGVIAGTVTDAETGSPIEGMIVGVWNASGALVNEGSSDASGQYSAGNLLTGTHYLATQGLADYLDEVYDDIPCPRGPFFGCEPTDGTPVKATIETTTDGIDFALEHFGAISGSVVAATGGQPIPFIDVEVRDADGSFAAVGDTDASGAYTVGGLGPGFFFVITRTSGFLDELYDDVPCPRDGSCEVTTGTTVAVAANATTEGIDFALKPSKTSTLLFPASRV